jgi:hypothetical protein
MPAMAEIITIILFQDNSLDTVFPLLPEPFGLSHNADTFQRKLMISAIVLKIIILNGLFGRPGVYIDQPARVAPCYTELLFFTGKDIFSDKKQRGIIFIAEIAMYVFLVII